MFATTHLYDQSREEYFADLPSRRFGHISSNVSNSVHTSVVMSTMHRLLVACGELGNFVVEVARMIADLQQYQDDTGCTQCGALSNALS